MTGVPEPTLRAWERRYGVPSPQRTDSGYRLYSTQDVERVREMRRLCDNGMAAAEAAALLVGDDSGSAGRAKGGTRTRASDPYGESRRALLGAVEAFDDDALDRHLRTLMLLGDTSAIVECVIMPALKDIGDRWHDGSVSVAQEHFASQRLGTLLRDLLRLSPTIESTSRVVLACFADEQHELGLLGVAMRFSSWGLRPVFLGARTPPGAIRSAVEAMSPVLVALSVTVTPAGARARELVDDYASACRGVPWIVGGAALPTIASLIRARGGMIAPDDPVETRAIIQTALQSASFVRSPARRRGKNGA